ncbi:MAG: hypothetical protein FWG77_02850 [Treponema sp.]|nr:hypothetical protein [Treponema sp.]
MENFKKKLKFGQVLLAAKLFFACGVFSLSSRYFEAGSLPGSTQDLVSGFQFGLIMGLFGVLLFYIIRNIRAIRNPDRLKQLHISETDERKLFIRQNSCATGMNFIIYGLAVGTAVSGSINTTVFFTLMAACFFVISVRGVLFLYYKLKV